MFWLELDTIEYCVRKAVLMVGFRVTWRWRLCGVLPTRPPAVLRRPCISELCLPLACLRWAVLLLHESVQGTFIHETGRLHELLRVPASSQLKIPILFSCGNVAPRRPGRGLGWMCEASAAWALLLLCMGLSRIRPGTEGTVDTTQPDRTWLACLYIGLCQQEDKDGLLDSQVVTHTGET